MATKLIVFAALFGHLDFASPMTQYLSYGNEDNHVDHHYKPSDPYHFQYDVKDPHTHDIKSQHEVSDGHGNVKGSYSLLEADGSTRVVEYTADHEHGFNAVVKKIESPQAHHYHHDSDYYGHGEALSHYSFKPHY